MYSWMVPQKMCLMFPSCQITFGHTVILQVWLCVCERTKNSHVCCVIYFETLRRSHVVWSCLLMAWLAGGERGMGGGGRERVRGESPLTFSRSPPPSPITPALYANLLIKSYCPSGCAVLSVLFASGEKLELCPVSIFCTL